VSSALCEDVETAEALTRDRVSLQGDRDRAVARFRLPGGSPDCRNGLDVRRLECPCADLPWREYLQQLAVAFRAPVDE
jgi:hypothetical protein